MVTIADVAATAGVSISTVSYVMSGKRSISAQTRRRVEQAIADLEYSPHASARSLASRSTNVIGLQAPLRPGVDVRVVMEILAGVVREAREHRYDILLLSSDDAAGLGHTARASMVDALLVMDVESDDRRIATLAGLSVPSVLIGLPDGAEDAYCVDFDFEEAGAMAAQRLIELGHTRLALLGAPEEVMQRHTSYADRLARGFLRTAAARGVEAAVHACPSSVEAVHLVDDVLASTPQVTGFLIHNEAALPSVAQQLATHTRAAPQTAPAIDAIALGPADLARAVPNLTHSIDIPAEQIGATAMRVIREILAGETPDRVHLLAPQLTSALAD